MDVAKLAMLRFPVMSEKVKRLHLVDGTFELFRAHYTKRPGRQAPDGRPIKATYGVLDKLLRPGARRRRGDDLRGLRF